MEVRGCVVFDPILVAELSHFFWGVKNNSFFFQCWNPNVCWSASPFLWQICWSLVTAILATEMPGGQAADSRGDGRGWAKHSALKMGEIIILWPFYGHFHKEHCNSPPDFRWFSGSLSDIYICFESDAITWFFFAGNSSWPEGRWCLWRLCVKRSCCLLGWSLNHYDTIVKSGCLYKWMFLIHDHNFLLVHDYCTTVNPYRITIHLLS